MRTLDELLNLNTYQGMSDAEIDLLISYHRKDAVQTAEFIATANRQNAELEILYEREQEKARAATALLYSMAGRAQTSEEVE